MSRHCQGPTPPVTTPESCARLVAANPKCRVPGNPQIVWMSFMATNAPNNNNFQAECYCTTSCTRTNHVGYTVYKITPGLTPTGAAGSSGAQTSQPATAQPLHPATAQPLQTNAPPPAGKLGYSNRINATDG